MRTPGEIYGEIARPQETHAACIFLLDTSDSMNYPQNKRPIDSLNEAVKIFKEQACQDKTNGDVIDVAVIAFGGDKAKVVSNFTPVSKFRPPVLTASGCTPMGDALELAIDMARKRVHQYHNEGTDAHIPWIVMITDGYPTDDITKAKKMLEEERSKGKYGHIKLWIVAVPGAKYSLCKELTQGKRILYVEDKDFRSIFNWTAESMVMVSQSGVNERLKVAPLPTNVQMALDDWANDL